MTIDPKDIMMTRRQQLDRDSWLQQHSLIWGRHQWEQGTLMSVCAQTAHTDGTKGRFRTLGLVPINDAEAAWSLIEPAASEGASTWVSVGGLAPAVAATPNSRGGGEDVLALPALFADLDIAGPGHKLDNLPTVEEAMAWIEQMPIKPTLVVHTGGGFHVWVALTQLLDPQSEDGKALLAGWKQWWVALAEQAGRGIDKGVLGDPARILRPAGTVNTKEGTRPVQIASANPEISYSVADLLLKFDNAPSSTTRRMSAPPIESVAGRVESREPGAASRVGDEFSRAVPASTLFERVFKAKRVGATGLIVPRRDGSYAGDSNAQIYIDADLERVTVFGERVKAELGGFENWDHPTGTSWDYLVQCAAGGDARLAARTLRSFAPDWAPCLDDIWQKCLSGAQAAASHEAESAVPEAFDGGKSGTRIELENGLVATIGGPRTGLYRRSKSDDGDTREVQITSWVAWKREAIEHLSVDTAGHSVTTAETEYAVEILTARGRRLMQSGFDAATSNDPKRVLDVLDVGAVLPVGQVDVKHVGNMLRELGRYGGRITKSEHHTMGWMEDGDDWVYLMPAGTIAASTVTDRYTVGAPAGSHAGALNPALRQAGFEHISEDPRKDAAAVNSFIRTLPKRPEVAYVLLGALFAAPLGLSRRTAVILAGKPGTGKSAIASALQAFYSGVGVDGSSFALTLARGTSKVAGVVTSSFMRHQAAIFDDYRHTGSARADETANDTLIALVQGAYGADGAGKGTQAGGLREAKPVENIAIITAEMLPTGEAIVSRSVPLELHTGDADLSPRGSCGFDVFVNDYADTGRARAFYAAYISWIAGQIKAAGGLRAFRKQVDAIKASWVSSSHGRAAETVATIAVGWMMLHRFAAARSFTDQIPPLETIDKALLQIVGHTASAAQEATPARRIIEKAAELVDSSSGHLLTAKGTPLAGRETVTGWERHPTADEWVPRTASVRIGYVTDDLKHIVLINDAVAKIKNLIGLTSMNADQVKRSLQELVAPGTIAGIQISADWGIDGRPRGSVIPAELFGIDLGTEKRE